MIEMTGVEQIPITGSEKNEIRPGEEGRTPATVADRIVEMLYGKLGEKGVTQLTADRQEEKLGDIEDGYYEGYRSGYKEGSTDLLTGVGGRRTTVHDLYQNAHEIIRAGYGYETDNQRKPELIIMMLDFNGLKDANDIFGHQLGDLLLKIGINELKDVFRTTDVIGRIGGDEFEIQCHAGNEKSSNHHTTITIEKLIAAKALQSLADSYNAVQTVVNRILTQSPENIRAEIEQRIQQKKARNPNFDEKRAIQLIGTVSIGMKAFSPERLTELLAQAETNAKAHVENSTSADLQVEIEEQFHDLIAAEIDTLTYKSKDECKKTVNRSESMVTIGSDNIESTSTLSGLKQELQIGTGALRLNPD